MTNNREFISPAETECLLQLEEEHCSALEEIENIQHILWMNFQDSAHCTSTLYKERNSSGTGGGVGGGGNHSGSHSNMVQFQFQRAAIAVTRLYKDSVDAIERAFELGQQYGNLQCRRNVSKWGKRKQRKINRLDLLRHLTRPFSTPSNSDTDSDEHLSGVLSGLGVASPRAATCTAASPRAARGTPRTGESSGLQAVCGVEDGEVEEINGTASPPHCSRVGSPSLYVSRKRKAESLFDEFLETVHSAKRNRK